jgi:hypothetical protein
MRFFVKLRQRHFGKGPRLAAAISISPNNGQLCTPTHKLRKPPFNIFCASQSTGADSMSTTQEEHQSIAPYAASDGDSLFEPIGTLT